MDLVGTPDRYLIRADLPGLDDEDVNIQLEDNVLTISGERITGHEDQQEGYYQLERAFGSFSRSLTLPPASIPTSSRPVRARRAANQHPQAEPKKPRQFRST
jgi:HSP20 family protein